MSLINTKPWFRLILPQYDASVVARTLSVREPSVMPPRAAVACSVDTLLACRSPGLAWDGTGVPREPQNRPPDALSHRRAHWRAQVPGVWMGWGTWCIVQIYPSTSVMWHTWLKLGRKRVLKSLEGYQGQYRCQMQAARTPGLCSAYGRSWDAPGM